MGTRRVVITGVGPVSAIGVGRDVFFGALAAGRCGIAPLRRFHLPKGAVPLAAEIVDFDVREFLESDKTYLDRSSEFAFAAMSLAVEDADIDLKGMDRARVGLILGTGFGSLETMGLFFGDVISKGPRFAKPVLFPHAYPNTAISLIAIEYGLSGFHNCFASGGISSSLALAHAYEAIREGRADLVFAGGYESLNPFLVAGYGMWGCLSRAQRVEDLVSPYDRRADGIVLGEGAGVVAVEELSHAHSRGAPIYGEICGCGIASGAGHADGPRAGGVERACVVALERAGLPAEQIDYVSGNGNGSPDGDRHETAGLTRALGPSAGRPTVGSVKALFGETLGAAGALQFIAAIGAMRGGTIPAMPNMLAPLSGLPLRFVGKESIQTEIRTVLLSSVDAGSGAVALIVGRGREV